MQTQCSSEYLAAQGLSPTLPERFWSKVNKDGPVPEHMPHLGKCWVWTGAKSSGGYGCIARGGARVGVISAHISSWILHFGKVPKSLCICHRCDVPRCVNPSHLFLGTRKDNSQDMLKKGRDNHRYGPDNSKTKLTESQVREIRLAYDTEGDSLSEIAEEYGVTIQSIWAIVKWKTWTWA